MMSLDCLVTKLARFKQSSKEAVESLELLSSFKKYMHVERSCERELKNILADIQQKDRPHLVMVCGSVGDGKSHLISYLKHNHPNLFFNVEIHNDATESFAPKKTFAETLYEKMLYFSDDYLKQPVRAPHLVVAINLGTLNNFLNSEYGEQFSTLREFVYEKKIIEEEQSDYQLEGHFPFRFINLSDFHLYELTEQGVESSFQEELLDRVVAESDANPFYSTFRNTCMATCPVREDCPVKKNYVLLKNKKVQRAIIGKLAELNIKYKVLISPRAYLNFLYHILVDGRFSHLTHYEQIVAEMEQMSVFERVQALLPNLFFDFALKNELWVNLGHLAPGENRSEKVDALTISFFNTHDLEGFFLKYVDSEIFERLRINSALYDSLNYEDRKTLYLTMLRLTELGAEANRLPVDHKISQEDEIYKQYLLDLYHWNKGEIKELKRLYKDVRHAIYHWNGSYGENRIRLDMGGEQTKFSVCQELDVKEFPKGKQQLPESKLERFLTHMILYFKVELSNQLHTIDLDYHLYKLIWKIRKGYRPNHQDRTNFIQFTDFIEKINKDGLQDQKIQVIEHRGSQVKVYTLYKNAFGEYVFQGV
jgi:DNA phosphorothioation-dependent restriction protein DptF